MQMTRIFTKIKQVTPLFTDNTLVNKEVKKRNNNYKSNYNIHLQRNTNHFHK